MAKDVIIWFFMTFLLAVAIILLMYLVLSHVVL
jgi:hypothetical protein